jgi:hypothetical protein
MSKFYCEKVRSRDGRLTGRVRGERGCKLAGCRGLQLAVRWSDGKLTWPCTKSLVHTRQPGTLKLG